MALKISRRSILTLFGMAPALKVPLRTARTDSFCSDQEQQVFAKFSPEDFNGTTPISERDYRIPFIMRKTI